MSSYYNAAPRRVRDLVPVTAVVISFMGLFAAATLSLGYVLDLPVPCGGSNGCASVAAHSSSKLLGVPIAFFGVATYLAIIWLLTRIAQTSWAPLLLTVVTGIGAITSAVLRVYAQLVIQATCRWCVASGIAMAVLFALSLYLYRRGKNLVAIPIGTVWWLSTAIVFALGGEMWVMQRQAIAAPIPPAKLAAVSISELLATGNLRGPNDAPAKIIMFSDLWCSICRAVNGPLMDFQAAHPTRVQVIFRHRPLTWVRGHETSATAAALSEIAAEHGIFWRFVDEVYGQSEPLDRAGYLRLFHKLGLPAAAAEDVFTRHGTPSGQVGRDVSLADRLGLRVTPVFIVLIGEDPPVAVNHRGLAKILNSEAVQAMISR